MQTNNNNNNIGLSQPSMIDCFRLTKVYDWIKLKSKQHFNFLVPTADLPAIEKAVSEGHILKITANVPTNEVKATVIGITRDYPDTNCGCISIQKIIKVYIKIYDQTANVLLSSFEKTVQLFDSTKACIPSPLDEDNVEIAVVGAEGRPVSTAPIDGFIAVEVSTCQDIEVVLDIKAKIKIEELCTSSEGKPCQGTVDCEFGKEKSTGYYPPTCTGNKCK